MPYRILMKNGLYLTFQNDVDKELAQVLADLISYKISRKDVEVLLKDAMNEAIEEIFTINKC